MAEGELEEAETVGPAAAGLLGAAVAGEAGDHGDVRVDGMPDGHALALEGLVVVVDPGLGLGGIDEGESQGADAELSGEVDGLAVGAGDPDGRVGLLHRLGHHVARGHREELTLKAGVRIHHHHVGDLLDRLAPHGPPLAWIHAVALELRP